MTLVGLEYLVDGVSFLELVRQAELPDARAEQAERAEEFAPEPAPLLAGDYMYAPRRTVEELLGERAGVYPPDDAEPGETMLLGCTCGVDGCWALMAKIMVTEATVTWSGFRNTHRDWNYDAIGTLSFPRRQYEESLRRALGS